MAPVLESSMAAGVSKTVVTFHPHPQEFFTGQHRSLLTPLEEKVLILQNMGFEQLVLLPFDEQLASLSPQAFVQDILVQQLQAKLVSVGVDFCFGRQRSGTVDDLTAIAQDYGVSVAVVPLQQLAGERISSSRIRQALQSGNLHQANHLLGRAYRLIGQVVAGQQLGRTLGFPTANLKLPPEKFLPRHGVYAVRVQCPDGRGTLLPGVMNLGHRPTVNGTTQTVEVHLLDWSGELYGQQLIVSLDTFLRPEQRFASLDDLTAQIQRDCAQARAYTDRPYE
jgi:riboflavin kinase/FMN adenylyltransferase